jgi:hypothetical protein
MNERRQRSRSRARSQRLYRIAPRAIVAERTAQPPNAAVLVLDERIVTIVRARNTPVSASHHPECRRSGGADCLKSRGAMRRLLCAEFCIRSTPLRRCVHCSTRISGSRSSRNPHFRCGEAGRSDFTGAPDHRAVSATDCRPNCRDLRYDAVQVGRRMARTAAPA